MVQNPNWLEADQLAVYKRGRGVELEATEKQLPLAVRATIQMKATEQHFPALLSIILYKVVLSLDSVNEILKCDHSNERYRAVLSHDTIPSK